MEFRMLIDDSENEKFEEFLEEIGLLNWSKLDDKNTIKIEFIKEPLELRETKIVQPVVTKLNNRGVTFYIAYGPTIDVELETNIADGTLFCPIHNIASISFFPIRKDRV